MVGAAGKLLLTVTASVPTVPVPHVLLGVTLMVCAPRAVQLMVALLPLGVTVPPPDTAHVYVTPLDEGTV